MPSQPTGAATTESVDPHAYARAQRVENRLIKLIDGGEDLSIYYPRPNLSKVTRGTNGRNQDTDSAR